MGADLYHIDGTVLAAREQVVLVLIIGTLKVGRVHDHFSRFGLADAYCRDRAIPRNVGNAKCERRCDHAKHIRIVLIDREYRDHHLHFVAQIVVEERPYRAVNDAS